MSSDHELCQGLPQGIESWKGNCQNQAKYSPGCSSLGGHKPLYISTSQPIVVLSWRVGSSSILVHQVIGHTCKTLSNLGRAMTGSCRVSCLLSISYYGSVIYKTWDCSSQLRHDCQAKHCRLTAIARSKYSNLSCTLQHLKTSFNAFASSSQIYWRLWLLVQCCKIEFSPPAVVGWFIGWRVSNQMSPMTANCCECLKELVIACTSESMTDFTEVPLRLQFKAKLWFDTDDSSRWYAKHQLEFMKWVDQASASSNPMSRRYTASSDPTLQRWSTITFQVCWEA